MKVTRKILTALLLLISAQVIGQGLKKAVSPPSHTRIDVHAKHFLLFSYFKDQHAGAYLAISTDGTHWHPVNNGRPVIVPSIGSEKLMRDPSIHFGNDGVYRMVWTSGWKGKNIGFSTSTDLIHWSTQRALPVGEHIDSTTNCWAPEIFYDDLKKQYMIFWSSNVGEWKKMGSEGRIYFVTTTDFNTFSDPGVLFKNGFPAGGEAGNDGPIDAFIWKDAAGQYLMFYKKDDNTGIPTLFYRRGATPQGPWQEEHGPLVPSTGDEGPSVVKMGDTYSIFTDPFENKIAYRFYSTDLINWKRAFTDLKMSHGTVIEISKAAALRLMSSR